MTSWEAPGLGIRPALTGYPSHAMKLARSLEHLGVLFSYCQLYAENSAFEVFSNQDVSTGEHVVSVSLRAVPPAFISVVASDCVHNLRQTLDHLAYQLAIHVAQADPPPNQKSSAFPIFTTKQDGQDHVLDDGRLRAAVGDPRQVTSDIRSVLEGLQPFYGGETQLLKELHDLENIAKHRHLPVCVGAVIPDKATADGASIGPTNVGPLDVGQTELARFKMEEGTERVWIEGRIKVEVMLAPSVPGSGLPITQYLMDTRNYLINSVVRPLEAILFPGRTTEGPDGKSPPGNEPA